MSTQVQPPKVRAKPKKLTPPVYDASRKTEPNYDSEFAELMNKYDVAVRKREQEKIKRREYKKSMTPEAKKYNDIRAYSRDYINRGTKGCHIDKAIHLILMERGSLPDDITDEAVIKIADGIASEYTRKPNESIKDREARILKAMERSKRQVQQKAASSSISVGK